VFSAKGNGWTLIDGVGGFVVLRTRPVCDRDYYWCFFVIPVFVCVQLFLVVFASMLAVVWPIGLILTLAKLMYLDPIRSASAFLVFAIGMSHRRARNEWLCRMFWAVGF